MKNYFSLVIFFFTCSILRAQSPQVEVLTSGTKTSIRGLSVVNDNVVWVIGSNGMVANPATAVKTGSG